MNINKLISYVSMILIVMLFVGVVSATEADSGDILETNNENTIVEQSSVIDTSGSQETDDVSEVLSAGDSEVLGAGEGTYTELHELIQGNATININKDYKYDPDVDKKYSWNGYEDAQDYKYGIPIWDVKAGFNNVKTITINGNGHTIDGNHMARIFNASHLGQLTVSGVNLVINNLTFINGCVESADTSTSRGGAILVGPYKVTLTLNNCTFEDNMAKNTNMGDPVGNESNYGTAWGGAVYINGISGTDYSTLYVNNCTFRNNTANYGGAIASSSTNAVGKVYIKDSLFDDNHADSHPYNYSNGQYYFNGKWYSHGWGGAVYAYYTEVLNSTFVNNRGGNRSGFGGAISTYKGKFEDSKFINNTCYQGGAIADGHLAHGTSAVDTDSSKYEIDNCTFDNNKAQLSGGAVLTRNLGAYFFASYGDMVVNNSNFTNNYGGIYGGGAIMSSCPFIYNSNFINNSAYNYGGAVTAGYAELGNVTFTNNSAAHSGALFCIEPYFIENTEVTFNDNYIIPRVLYDNGFTTNDTEVQDGKVIVTSDLSFYVSGNRLWNLDPAWTKWIPLNGTEYLPLMYIYKDSPAMNKGVGYYGFDYEVDLYGHAIEYDHKDVKGGYGQVSPGGAEGIVTDDLSYLINYIDGRELKEYIKILYYLCNLNESFMDGAFRNKEAGELALEFPIKELCFSDLSNPINDLMKNITDLYDSGFRVPNNYYKLSDTLKDHMAHSNVMVPDNADDILKDDKTVIIYHPFLYIVPFYHTHYLSYYQTNITIEKITLNKTVMLGEDVEFKVTVTNGGNYSVYDIFVQDYQYDTDGLIYKGYKNDTGKWVYDEQTRKYNLVDVEHYVSVNPLNNQVVEEDVVGALKPRTSKSIIFVFTTNKTGVFNNTATNGYSNATNNTTVIAPDLKIEKITLNKTVYLGNQTMFKLRVTNTGAFDLSNIIVEEYEYDDGLVLADFKADWPWFGNINTKKFVYLDTLKPGESSEFIVIFNTTKIGNFTNYAVATHNKTGNRTANNTTEVIFMINITKIWDDADNQDGIRPKNVTVELLADGEKVDEIVLSENNNWTAYFKELHGYNEEGNLINYTVKELKVDNYTTINLGNITALNITINNNSFEIKNNHTPLLTNVTVNKKWDDRDNQDGIRPPSIVVNLLADGNVIDQATLSLTAGSNWTYTFVNLPVNKKGKKINYTIEEVDVDGYEFLITNSTLYNWTVTNVHVPELVNVTVQKVWSDADNQDGFRPVSVEVQLLANGTVINSTVLDASNGWKFTFYDLDKYYNGTVIVYSVNETSVVNYTADITSDGNGNWTVNNTHVPELINITVNKVWEDNDDYDKVRPDTITVQLYANGVKVNETIISGDKWEYTFLNLPKYENGSLINYTVNETAAEGYNVTVDNFTITNTHIRPNMTVEKITITKTVLLGQETSFTIVVTNTGNVKLSKVTVVEEVPKGLRYDGKFTGKDWYNNGVTFIYNAVLNPGESTSFNITFATVKSGNWTNVVMASSNETENKTANNNTTVIPIVINITKEWNDSDDQDGIRPGSVTVELFADGVKVNETVLSEDNKWNASFVELPAYKDGKEIVYTIGEVEVDKYNVTVNETNGSFVITNTHVPDVLNITVNKVWNDSDDQDGVRPDGVTVYLLADGVKVNETTISAKDGWTFTFADLAVNKDGKPIVYTVEEDDVDKYPIVDIADVGNNTFNVTNTHIPELVNITVKKNWNDSDDQDGVRPDSVTIELFADGVKVNETTLSEDNDWKDIFKDLPKFKAGELIKYTVNETKVANYTINITDDGKGNWTVNNTHVPELINITVNKVWEDNDDYDKVRPDTITVMLYANGKNVVNATLSGDKWEYTFLNLPKYENGSLINYTVNETAVEGYNVTVDNFTITNTHIRPNMTVEKITITKTVLLGQETSFTIKVTNNGNVKLSKVTVVEEVPKGLRYDGKFTGKDWYNNGVTFIYNAVLNPGESTSFNITFATVKSGNWTNVVMASSNETENKTANNNTTVIPIVINVTKEWNDSDDQDGIRPGSVTVELFADGVKVNETVLSEDNKWNDSFVELPAYKDGKEIVYTIGEVKVDGYDVSVNETNGSFVITNTHVPEVLNITVNKVWNDSDNQDGVRPDGVTVYLLADGVKVNETTLSAKDGWTFTFVGLAVNKEGKAIVYTVEEDSVDNYPIVDIANVGNNTFNVTNTHIPELINITVKKNWNDSDDQDGVRPDSVTIELFADGVKVNETTLSEDNKWEDIFKDLPKFKAGELIKYTVNETAVANYTVNITDDGKGNFTVNNTHVPEVTNVTVVKVWIDNDDYDKVRPTSISVQLYANGKKVNETTLSGDKWEYIFLNLPKYENGELIKYTVNETAVEGYNVTVDNFTITNTHIRPNMTVEKITITKTVLLGQETSFTIKVTNNGNVKLSKVTVVEEVPKGLRYDGKFTGKDWYNNGVTFIYNAVLNPGESTSFNITFATVKSGNWTNVVMASSNETENKTANNNTTVIPIVINVTKEWNDSDDQDGIRPGSVTVELFADGVKVNETVLSEDNKWNDSFVELPAYKDGKEIVYTISEAEVDKYNASIKETNGSFVITNTHIPELINITVNKVWNDSDDQDGVRPDGVTVYLLADGVKVNETTLSAKDGWTFTFAGLAVNKEGKAIVYTVEEDSVDNYPIVDIADVGNNTFNVTNTHIPELINITVIKIWNDNDDYDKVRPTTITVQLYANGVKVNETTISGDKWEHTFVNLPKFANGELIKYTINETKVADYNTTIDNFTITNTHVRPNMTVRKISLNESVYLGTPVAFTVVVTNIGDCDLTGVYVIDNDFTEGIVLDHMVPNDNWIFDGKDKFTYVPDVLHVGESANFTIWFNTTSVGSKINNVTADSNETPEVNSTNKTFVYVADMTVRKISLNESVYLGTPVAFTVVVTNNGTIDLTGVYVVDNDFTEGIVLDHMESNDDWIFDGKDRFTYVPDVLHVGESANFTIWFNTTSIGDKINNVTADSNETPEVNSSNKTHVYVGNMSVRKISLNESVYLGNQVGFIVVVTNTGDCDLPGVYVVDNDFTEGIVLDHMDPNGDWTFNGKDKFTYNHDVLPVGESANFTIWFNTTSTGFKVNNVTAGNNLTPEVNSTNNTTVYKPDLGVRKISLHKSVYLGTPVAFIVVVTNIGDCDLTGVYVVDNDFTEGIVLDHMEPNDDWIFDGKDRFTYVPDVLHVGESANFTIWFNTTSIGDKINNVTADSNETPEVNSSNKTHVYVGNMSVRKISLNESVYLGNQVGFIVVVTNTGDCDLPGVYVVDNDFSEGIVLDHMVPNADWTFDGKDRFTYNHDVLGVGESANFTIWFNTTSVGDKINNVTAGNDLTPDVNSSNKTHVYDGELTVRKISNNESVKVGEQVSFTIVVKNTGGCDLTGVYVVDNDYSSGLVYDHFVDSSNKWNYEGNGKWTFTDVLGIGEEASFDVIFNATTVGVKFNNVTAGDNITNKTVNSTNKTNVTNKTVPPEPEPPVPEPPVPVPPQPVPPSPEVPDVPSKEIPVKHATGNPILVLLLVLFTLSVNVSRRKKQ